ncbi:hypothetical protein TBK1r_22530 [Stieleria magnilauensis]|uniref:Uncharacterized protein n=1 Tax=Stieleria magnilauensis TaxID=2527963 RepID=A0ABX5XPN7_9BACT|nr:hypothetical protein TBK1r_22530 [Planctomycetes bacterium TBK1r]
MESCLSRIRFDSSTNWVVMILAIAAFWWRVHLSACRFAPMPTSFAAPLV